MILGSGKIWMCKEPTDMRLGYNGLSAQVRKIFSKNPYRGQSFVFINRRRTSCKVYYWDGSGEVILSKRLNQGVFCRPNPYYRKNIQMSRSEFSQFFEGLNMNGKILESVPNHFKMNKNKLRFIPSYRRLALNGNPENRSQKESGERTAATD